MPVRRITHDKINKAHNKINRKPHERPRLAAEHTAPDEVRYRAPIQKITTSMLSHPTAQTLPGLRAFAKRIGTPV